MVFPGKKAKILDLYSSNGTVLANIRGGVKFLPGRIMDLTPGDFILLAKGIAIFQYLGPNNVIEEKKKGKMEVDRPPDKGMNQGSWVKTAEEVKNIIKHIYKTFCGKKSILELDISLDPIWPTYTVTHRKKGTHVKIPARLFIGHPKNLQIASIRRLLHRLG